MRNLTTKYSGGRRDYAYYRIILLGKTTCTTANRQSTNNLTDIAESEQGKESTDNVNVILNYQLLKDMIEKNLRCYKCEEEDRGKMLENFVNFVSTNPKKDI